MSRGVLLAGLAFAGVACGPGATVPEYCAELVDKIDAAADSCDDYKPEDVSECNFDSLRRFDCLGACADAGEMCDLECRISCSDDVS